MATTTLKGTIIEQIFYKDASQVGTTPSTHALNWQNYDILIIQSCLYANPRETCVAPKIYFVNTNSGNRPILFDSEGDLKWEVYQDGEGSIKAFCTKTDSIFRLKIFGIKFK